MKKTIVLFSILIFGLLNFNLMAQTNSDNSDNSGDTLTILWTDADPDKALKMVFMYAKAAKQNGWFSEVELIVWGPSAKLTAENEKIQIALSEMQEVGISTFACKACADSYNASRNLEALGIDVKYMGVPLTDALKSDKKILTF